MLDILLEQVSGKAVTQRVRTDALLDANCLRCLLDGPIGLARRDGLERVPAGKQPTLGQHEAASLALALPPLTAAIEPTDLTPGVLPRSGLVLGWKADLGLPDLNWMPLRRKAAIGPGTKQRAQPSRAITSRGVRGVQAPPLQPEYRHLLGKSL